VTDKVQANPYAEDDAVAPLLERLQEGEDAEEVLGDEEALDTVLENMDAVEALIELALGRSPVSPPNAAYLRDFIDGLSEHDAYEVKAAKRRFVLNKLKEAKREGIERGHPGTMSATWARLFNDPFFAEIADSIKDPYFATRNSGDALRAKLYSDGFAAVKVNPFQLGPSRAPAAPDASSGAAAEALLQRLSKLKR
jgi:hypothetical protein